MPITLRQLEIFAAVAKYNSISKAAKSLKLSQPAVSKQIHQMERLLGVPVVDIIKQRVHITQMGRKVLEHAQRFDELLSDLNDTVTNSGATMRGTLRLGMGTSITGVLLNYYKEFRSQNPEVGLQLTVANRDNGLDYIFDNTIDMMIMPRPYEMESLVGYELFRFNFYVVARADHEKAGLKNVKMKELAHETFVMFNRQRYEQDMVFGFFNRHLEATHIEIDNISIVKEAVKMGIGIAILPDFMVGEDLKNGSLVALDVAGFPMSSQVSLVHLKNKKLNAVTSAFKDFLLSRDSSEFVPQIEGLKKAKK
jgi:DNA-binding transcriptional LysR family regulator